jgi:hypothetical protein
MRRLLIDSLERTHHQLKSAISNQQCQNTTISHYKSSPLTGSGIMAEPSRKIQRDELYELVWAKPTLELAKEFGISDVALSKICKKMNVPKPPLGYWQRIAADYEVTPPSLLRPDTGQLLVADIWLSIANRRSWAYEP